MSRNGVSDGGGCRPVAPPGTPSIGLDARVRDALASLAASLDVVCDVDAHELSVESLFAVVREVETASRRLAAVNSAVLVALESDGRWAADGSRSLAAWVRRATDASPGRAHRQTRTARALREHLPLTGDALRSGAIGTEHADLLAKHTTGTAERLAGLRHPEVGEAFLVEKAAELDAGDFGRLLRRWAIAADPEAADREWKDDADKEHLVLAKSLHGYHLQGWLSDAGGAALDEALRARLGVPAAGDGRTTAQRRAAALVGLARLALDAGAVAPGAAIRPHLTVHVPYDTLERLAAAQAPASGPTGRGAARRLPAEAPASGAGSDLLSWRGAVITGCSSRAPGGAWAPGADSAARAPGADSAARAPGADSAARAPGADSAARAPSADSAARAPGARTATPASVSPKGAPAPSAAALEIPGRLDHGVLVGVAPAELDDGTPLPHALLARLACDSELARVVFGPASEILDSGRTKRLFTPGQRRAVIARDRTCRYPGCDAPPHEGEIHHSIWWYAQHGRTRAKDGVLLCWFHHDHVHANAISISRTTPDSHRDASEESSWDFHDRTGRPIDAASAGRGRGPAAGSTSPPWSLDALPAAAPGACSA